MTSHISLETAGILSVWLETLLYGIYTSLFFETVFIMSKNKRIRAGPSKIFFGAIVVMYITTTVHIAINLYRVLRAYVWLADEVGPAAYWGNLSRWDTITHEVFNAFTTWVGDSLVIYRCYIVWDNNLPIVMLPIAMVIMSIIANSIALHHFAQLGLNPIFSPSLTHWMNTIYALAFVQNTMTTGLIAYRILQQDRKSRGMITSSYKLIVLVRIIVESASIYVLNVLILIILYAIGSNGQYVAQEALVPVCGIVFTLITVRLSLHASTSVTATQHQTTQIKFAGFPGAAITTTGGFTTTTAQSTGTDSFKQAERIDGDASVSDYWNHVGEPRDNIPDSRDGVLLENLLGDEKVKMESDTPPGTV